MIYSILKTNSVKIANYHLSMFLSVSAWSSFSALIISAESATLYLSLDVMFIPSSREAFSKSS